MYQHLDTSQESRFGPITCNCTLLVTLRARFIFWSLLFFLLSERCCCGCDLFLLQHTEAKWPFLLRYEQVLSFAGQTVSPLGGQVDRLHLRQSCDFGPKSPDLARAR